MALWSSGAFLCLALAVRLAEGQPVAGTPARRGQIRAKTLDVNGAHPRLLFTADDIPAIRAKITNNAGDYDDADFVRIQNWASTLLSMPVSSLVAGGSSYYGLYNIPALTAANVWTWLEVDISDLAAGSGDSIGDVAILMSAQGEGALGAVSVYVDIAYVWDAAGEEALGVAIQQDGVLGVINTESGASLVELTDYIVHYEATVDFIVYITDQSSADIAVLAAY
jgi:hypothetical protein